MEEGPPSPPLLPLMSCQGIPQPYGKQCVSWVLPLTGFHPLSCVLVFDDAQTCDIKTHRAQGHYLKETGMHLDGDGLYLRISPTGGRSYVLRTGIYGNRRGLGLCTFLLVTLAEEREASRQLRALARVGGRRPGHRSQA